MKLTKRRLKARIKEEVAQLLQEQISEPELKAIKDTVRLLKLIEQIPALEGLWGEEEVAQLLDPERGEWVVKLEQAINNLDPEAQGVPGEAAPTRHGAPSVRVDQDRPIN